MYNVIRPIHIGSVRTSWAMTLINYSLMYYYLIFFTHSIRIHTCLYTHTHTHTHTYLHTYTYTHIHSQPHLCMRGPPISGGSMSSGERRQEGRLPSGRRPAPLWKEAGSPLEGGRLPSGRRPVLLRDPAGEHAICTTHQARLHCAVPQGGSVGCVD